MRRYYIEVGGQWRSSPSLEAVERLIPMTGAWSIWVQYRAGSKPVRLKGRDAKMPPPSRSQEGAAQL